MRRTHVTGRRRKQRWRALVHEDNPQPFRHFSRLFYPRHWVARDFLAQQALQFTRVRCDNGRRVQLFDIARVVRERGNGIGIQNKQLGAHVGEVTHEVCGLVVNTETGTHCDRVGLFDVCSERLDCTASNRPPARLGQRHGGSAKIDSEPGVGTEVHLRMSGGIT